MDNITGLLKQLQEINQQHKDEVFHIKMKLSIYLYDKPDEFSDEEFFEKHSDIFKKMDGIKEYIDESELFHIKADKWLNKK